jgi:hypothetical protein
MIVDVLPRNKAITEAEVRAYRADLWLRCGVEVGQMKDEELTQCSRRTSAGALRNYARAEQRRRDRLSK